MASARCRFHYGKHIISLSEVEYIEEQGPYTDDTYRMYFYFRSKNYEGIPMRDHLEMKHFISELHKVFEHMEECGGSFFNLYQMEPYTPPPPPPPKPKDPEEPEHIPEKKGFLNKLWN
jgi:hypothetical protein